MYTRLICLFLIIVSAGSASATDTITYYLDGTIIRREAAAVKGIIDLPLSADLLEQTLTVVPSHGTSIIDVQTYKTEASNSKDNNLENLTEQRRRLEDRLQALDTREAIFTAAAKTQSGKAPRKTKANPDPMQAIRQGTDFAIAQLEAVYTARRRTREEIRKIDARLLSAGKNYVKTVNAVKITVTPPRGRVTISYATKERSWQPEYNLHLSGDGSALLQLSARITEKEKGHITRVSPGSLTESSATKTFPVLPGRATLTSFHLPIKEEHYSEGIFNSFTGVITNNSGQYLPQGESGLYKNGSYLGKFRFEGISSSRSKIISVGK